ncbi:MAG: rhodanese-like domain-containing protein [Gammaproteobacteria bacterium]|nr:rhodanese-like domain-containing protein [Gammaproteobacteria bacterium]MCW9032185.1 rhodanese-like domain-containing protein [Gammaproteobacteria bacterium]
MNSKIISVISLALCMFGSAAHATDFSKLNKKKQTKLGLYLTATQAFDMMKNDHTKTLFIDVRTRPEINFLGMPTLADANVPYMRMNEWYTWNDKKQSFNLDVNGDFEKNIATRLKEKSLSKSDPIILMCRSGSRSAKAANLLADLGYKKVYTVVDGYEGDKVKTGEFKGMRMKNGWKQAKLPWTYELAKEKMYTASAE